MIEKLDGAGDDLEKALKRSGSDKVAAEIDRALKQLATTRSLLSLINTQAKYQSDRVRDRLPSVDRVLGQRFEQRQSTIDAQSQQRYRGSRWRNKGA